MIKRVSKKEVLSFAKKYFKNYSDKDNLYDSTIAYYKKDKIIAFMTYTIIYDRAEIEYFAVKEEFRGQGISDELYEYFEKGIKYLKNITLEVNKSNKRAIKFYKKKGFIKAAIRKNYYQNEDGYLMIKKLGE